MKIVTWNINSIRARLEPLVNWLQRTQPDILALQETKVIDADFPSQLLQEIGYHTYFTGQKSYNGVALLSKEPMENLSTQLLNFQTTDARIIIGQQHEYLIACVYVPNGRDLDSEWFTYKLDWLQALQDTLQTLYIDAHRLVILGDFNIAPSARDVYDPQHCHERLLCSTPEREALSQLCNKLGVQDAFAHRHPDTPGFTWWDYRHAAFRRNLGFRIDLQLASPRALHALKDIGVDLEMRRQPKPSDHAPVWAEYA